MADFPYLVTRFHIQLGLPPMTYAHYYYAYPDLFHCPKAFKGYLIRDYIWPATIQNSHGLLLQSQAPLDLPPLHHCFLKFPTYPSTILYFSIPTPSIVND